MYNTVSLSLYAHKTELKILLWDKDTGSALWWGRERLAKNSQEEILKGLLRVLSKVNKHLPLNKKLEIEVTNVTLLNTLRWGMTDKVSRELKEKLITLPVVGYSLIRKSTPKAKTFSGFNYRRKENLDDTLII